MIPECEFLTQQRGMAYVGGVLNVKALHAGARAREWVCNRLWIKISNYRTEGPMAYLVFTPFVSHIQASLAVHVSPLSILSGGIFVLT